MPLRGIVRISRCWSPSSPTAVRVALMRVVSANSDTVAPAPDGSENIVLADDAVAIGYEILQQVKHLGLHRDECIPTAEFAASRVKDKIFKEIEHFCPAGAG